MSTGECPVSLRSCPEWCAWHHIRPSLSNKAHVVSGGACHRQSPLCSYLFASLTPTSGICFRDRLTAPPILSGCKPWLSRICSSSSRQQEYLSTIFEPYNYRQQPFRLKGSSSGKAPSSTSRLCVIYKQQDIRLCMMYHTFWISQS